MQHQTVDATTTLNPDIEQAVEHLLPTVAEIRALTKDMVGQEPGGHRRLSLERQIADKMSLVSVRADRLGMSTDALHLVITAELDGKARRGRPAPSRETERTILSKRTDATARLHSAKQQARAWEEEVTKIIAELEALDEANGIIASRSASR